MPETSQHEPRYWFPAKSCGWGWGLPATWEGWLTMFVFIAACCGSGWLGGGSLPITIGGIVLSAVAFTTVAYWKGEPPRWRWGNNTKSF